MANPNKKTNPRQQNIFSSPEELEKSILNQSFAFEKKKTTKKKAKKEDEQTELEKIDLDHEDDFENDELFKNKGLIPDEDLTEKELQARKDKKLDEEVIKDEFQIQKLSPIENKEEEGTDEAIDTITGETRATIAKYSDIDVINKSNKIIDYINQNLNLSLSSEDIMFEVCFKFNMFYDWRLLSTILVKERSSKLTSSVILKYVTALKEDSKYSKKDFFWQLNRMNFERLGEENLDLLSLTEEDLKNRQQVISILGYDPFKDESIGNKSVLYHDLSGLLDESCRKDISRQKAAIIIAKNYLRINQYLKKENEYSDEDVSEENVKKIAFYQEQRVKLQDSTNKLAKENGFSGVKALGQNGRGTLSDVMSQVENKNYDAGITNFYDQATSKSIAEIARISFKAEMNQLKFSDVDYADILAQQADIVHKSQAKAREALEALRIAKEKIKKQELLEEYRKTLKRKGIDEKDIEDFVLQEYDLWEDKN